MNDTFSQIDRSIGTLMRFGVGLSLAFLAVIAAVAWPAQSQMGMPLYVTGFVVCGLSAAYGRRVLVTLARRFVRKMLASHVRVPPPVETRLRRLLAGANHQAVGLYMPKDERANRQFMLGIIEGDSSGDILISERVLECHDGTLQMMLGHEIGHLYDPPERSTPRNDVLLFWWCVWLAHAGAPIGVLLALFAVRLAAVAFLRMAECWVREVRADLYGAFVFGGPDGLRRFDRVFDEIDRATIEGTLIRKAERKSQNWTGSIALAAFLCVFFPNFAAFAAVNLVSKILFALMPTTHPPVRQRRDLARQFVKATTSAA